MIADYPPEPLYGDAWKNLKAAMFEAGIYDLIEEMRNKNA